MLKIICTHVPKLFFEINVSKTDNFIEVSLVMYYRIKFIDVRPN